MSCWWSCWSVLWSFVVCAAKIACSIRALEVPFPRPFLTPDKRPFLYAMSGFLAPDRFVLTRDVRLPNTRQSRSHPRCPDVKDVAIDAVWR
eukprot:3159995-Rhodomonas_salina.2